MRVRAFQFVCLTLPRRAENSQYRCTKLTKSGNIIYAAMTAQEHLQRKRYLKCDNIECRERVLTFDISLLFFLHFFFLTDLNKCHSGPCENGASCVGNHEDYVCICLRGWERKNCESVYSPGWFLVIVFVFIFYCLCYCWWYSRCYCCFVQINIQLPGLLFRSWVGVEAAGNGI